MTAEYRHSTMTEAQVWWLLATKDRACQGGAKEGEVERQPNMPGILLEASREFPNRRHLATLKQPPPVMCAGDCLDQRHIRSRHGMR
jgi:hypothetical protein